MALLPLFNLSKLLAVHAFSVGGIGILTLSMMAQVLARSYGKEREKAAWSHYHCVGRVDSGKYFQSRIAFNCPEPLSDLDFSVPNSVDCGISDLRDCLCHDANKTPSRRPVRLAMLVPASFSSFNQYVIPDQRL